MDEGGGSIRQQLSRVGWRSEAGGQASDIEIAAREILRMRELLETMLSTHTGRSMEQVRVDIERDKILTADEAVEYGLIDEVITSRKLTPVGAR